MPSLSIFRGLRDHTPCAWRVCRAVASSSTSRCTATPQATSATPTSSAAVGSWVSTTMPITVAMAGSSATISEYAARLRFAIASWSVTYGITDEQIPTPTPAANATGSVNACAAWGAATGVTATAAISIAAPSPSMPEIAGWRADPVREHDVGRKQGRVGKRERKPQGLRGQLHMAELVDAGHRERERERVAWTAHADRRQHDDREELDRGDRAQRQPGDRLVEAAVHRREDRAPADQQPDRGPVQPAERAPRPSPQREHHAPPMRSEAMPRRAPAPGRTAARRTTGRGSGTRR